jgi:hypothetical protein
MRRIETKVKLDASTHHAVKQWADDEERSTTVQVARLMRRLVALKESNPQALAQLGLLEPDLAACLN